MLFFGELLFLTERCFAGSKIHASSMDGGEPSSNGKMCSVRQNMWLSYQVHYLPFFNHFFMGMTLNGNNLINWFSKQVAGLALFMVQKLCPLSLQV